MLMRRLASPSATGPPKTDATTYGNQFRSGHHIHPPSPSPPPLLPIIEEIECNGTPDDDGFDSPVVTPGKRITGGLEPGKTNSRRTCPTATSIESSLLAPSPYYGNPTDFSSERSRDGVAGSQQEQLVDEEHRKCENSRFVGPCCRTCRAKHSPRVVARREPDKLRNRCVTLYRRKRTFDRSWSKKKEPIRLRAIDDAGAFLDRSRLDCPPDSIVPAVPLRSVEESSLASASNVESHSRGASSPRPTIAEQPILGETESTRRIVSLVGISRGIVHRQGDAHGSPNDAPPREMVGEEYSRLPKSFGRVDGESSSSSRRRRRRRRRNDVNLARNEDHGQNQDQKQVQTPRRWDGEAIASRRTSLDRPIVVVGDDARASETLGTNKSRKKSGKRSRSRWSDEKYGLVFVLYLLALPILCATNASLPIAAALAFPQNAPLAHAHNNNNASNRNGSTVLQGGKDQRYDENEEEKNTTRGHPYTEYAWEVNQINPWLSACDLAGPAPADLQGSCGPPETPKNCPPPCEIPRETTSKRDSDLFLAVVSQAAEYAGSRWRFATGRTTSRSVTGERVAPEQCLFYLEESHKREICRDGFGENSSHKFSTVQENRYRFLSGLRLRHCCEHAALNALAPGKGGPLEEVLAGGTRCTVALDKLLAVDALAARLHCEFGEVLARYDCGQQYSVIYNCSHCKEAYRRWVCSSLVPYFAHDEQPRRTKNEQQEGFPVANEMSIGMRIRSCRSFCQTVEQRCPYLLPGDRAPAYPTQYAGEPTFLCRDPNIPETGQQAARALHADDDCCFHVCSDNDPGLGVCTNCTRPEVEIAIRGGSRDHDPSSAPQCEINPSIPQGSTTGNHEPAITTSGSEIRATTEADMNSKGDTGSERVSTSSSSPASTTPGSFCGSGGVGSMTSGASPRTVAASIPPLILCAFCAWGVLVSTCTIRMTSPFRFARATVNSSRVTMTKCIKCSLTVIENWSSDNIARIVPGSTIEHERPVVDDERYSPLSRINFRPPRVRLRKIGPKPRLSEKIT